MRFSRLSPIIASSILLSLWPFSLPTQAKTTVFFSENDTFVASSTKTYTVGKRNQQTDYTFTLTNETSVDMVEFYASPQTASDWEANVLANKTVGANGDWTTVTLSESRGCMYDFLAVFADGDKLEKFGINVCELENHIYYDN